MSLSAGERLGPYEIVSLIGSGGMGEVWKARDTRLGRVVAIKRLSGQHSERFEQEARAVAALNHPNICQIHDVGPDYLVLEYIDGKPLRGPVSVQEAVRLAIQIASALEEADASVGWLEIIVRSGLADANRAVALRREASEVLAILAASRRTAADRSH